jgi:hypothetical protein
MSLILFFSTYLYIPYANANYMSNPPESKTYFAVPIHELSVAQTFSDIMNERSYHAPVETIREELMHRLGRNPIRIVSESQKASLRNQKSQSWAFYEIINDEIDTSPF